MAACEKCGDDHGFFSMGCGHSDATEANRQWLFSAWAAALQRNYVNGGITNALTRLKAAYAGAGPTEKERADYAAAYAAWCSIHYAATKQLCAQVASSADKPAAFGALAANAGLGQTMEGLK